MQTRRLEAGRYRRLERLTDTGGHVVWRALDEWSARPVILVEVVGVPDDSDDGPAAVDRARVAWQAEVAAGLTGEHLVRVTGLSADVERLFVVADGFPGETLWGVLQRPGPSVEDVEHWCADVADGLAEAHHAGLVHGDVHAGLVMLGTDGTARLAGLAATPRHHGGVTHPASEMSPGDTPTPAADVFAWAAMLRSALERVRSGGGATGEVEELLSRAMDPDPARRPDAATARDRLRRVRGGAPGHPVWPAPRPRTELVAPAPPEVSASEGRTDLVTPASPTGQRPADPPGRPDPGPAHRGSQQVPWPPGWPWPPPAGLPPEPPAGLPPPPWAMPTGPFPPGPDRLSGPNRLALALGGIVLVLLLIAGVVLTALDLAGGRASGPAPTPEPASLLGDPRTADPCSLLSVDAVRAVGPAEVAPDFPAPESCTLAIQVDPGYVDLEAQLASAFPEPPEGAADQVGALRVFRPPGEDGSCLRTIVLPDDTRVYLRAHGYQGAVTEPCRVADLGTAYAANTLTSGSVTRLATNDPPNALTTVDLCSVFDASVLAPVSGLNTSLRVPGWGGWSCQWGRNPTYPWAPQVLAATMSLREVSGGRPAVIAGRNAVIRPNAAPNYPQSCTIDVPHRTYAAEDGIPRTELLRLTVYAGRQLTPDVACAQATAVVTAVAPKLPPTG